MNICIYGASSTELDSSYILAAEQLGEYLGKAGNTLVFGGGANGLMGAVARGFQKSGANIIGIAPSFFNVDGVLFNACSQFFYTETMRQRKQLMEDKSDAFVAVPGGVGTFDEFFEILTLKQLGKHKKPIIIYNINGYFDNILKMLDFSVSERFMNQKTIELLKVCNNENELLDYLNNYSSDENYDVLAAKSIK